eukprot:TRINITY_DN1206_c0_g1_i4.p1 TRINITY_DN1206_c0_g1~~TRINITY_DN1206_c0_g1_i4.p1  ORF type:complete len:107 (+),score=21.21 TRINITY_DN1206_c0_g1_i4:101-421(+)
MVTVLFFFFFFQAEDGIRDLVRSRGLGDVYKRQGTLSVVKEYLGLEGGPPMFRQDFTCPALLEDLCAFYPYGAITHYGRPFQIVQVLTLRPLDWSAFASGYEHRFS